MTNTPNIGASAPSDTQKSIPENQKEGTVEDVGLAEKFLQFCIFRSGSEDYAIPIELVKEVVQCPPTSPLPQVPDYIIGVSNVRGNICGIFDLKSYLTTSKEPTNKHYLLVLDHEEYQIGLVIPDVPDTFTIPESEIENLPASRLKSVKGRRYLKGIIKRDKRMIILFDILGLVSDEEFMKVA